MTQGLSMMKLRRLGAALMALFNPVPTTTAAAGVAEITSAR
jgi:hypothetical protein